MVLDEQVTGKRLLYIQYSGFETIKFIKSLEKIEAPIRPIIVMTKLKSVLPSLKAPMELSIACNVVYKLTCFNFFLVEIIKNLGNQFFKLKICGWMQTIKCFVFYHVVNVLVSRISTFSLLTLQNFSFTKMDHIFFFWLWPKIEIYPYDSRIWQKNTPNTYGKRHEILRLFF